MNSKINKFLIYFQSIFLCLIGSSTIASTTLQPTDDSYGSSSGNGGKTELAISQWTHSFIRFDLHSINENKVSDALLRVYYRSSSAVNMMVLAEDNDGWNEVNTVLPSRSGFPWTQRQDNILAETSVASPGYVDIDVTEYVAQQYKSDGLASFEIKQESNGWQYLDSKEGANPPELIVTLVGDEDPDPDPGPIREGMKIGFAHADSAYLTNHGNFRISCEMSHLANVDPLVYPGQADASHAHMFFGNDATNEFSHNGFVDDPDTDIRLQGDSTCHGGTANRSAYWLPQLLDDEGDFVDPKTIHVYYKTGYVDTSLVQPMPDGLRMIGGFGAENFNLYRNDANWGCLNQGFSRNRSIPVGDNACQAGDQVSMLLRFPSCWVGHDENGLPVLDSTDHRSHMSYRVSNPDYHPSYDTARTMCPDTHPVTLPILSLFVFWEIPEGKTTDGWSIASDHDHMHTMPGMQMLPGSTIHGDFMNGWDEGIMQTMVTHCLNEKRDCADGELGDGRRLLRFGEEPLF